MAMETRRDRFRRQLARLAGTANPREAIEAGFYVPRPASSERLARKVELQPTAARVLTGPIGSGKSTELLALAEALNELPDLWAITVDVSLVHDLADLREGTLIAAALLASAGALNLSGDLTQGLEAFAYGSTGFRADGGFQEIIEPGVLTPPRLKITTPVDNLLRKIHTIVTNLEARTPVFLFDSLDRVRDTAGFRTVLQMDARMLVNKGFGVVLTAPIDTLWSDSEALRALADSWDTLPYEDPAQDPTARQFLLDILRRRVDPDMIPETMQHVLLAASGGVVRDLIELARSAVEEAYLGGCSVVGPTEVEAAITRLANALSLGVGTETMERLAYVRARRQIFTMDEPTVRMLKNRQILEYRDGSRGSYFVPHPVLEPLILRSAKAS